MKQDTLDTLEQDIRMKARATLDNDERWALACFADRLKFIRENLQRETATLAEHVEELAKCTAELADAAERAEVALEVERNKNSHA